MPVYTEQRGAIFRYTVQDSAGSAVDISSLTPDSTNLPVLLKLPGETVFTAYASAFVTDGTNGQAQFETTTTAHLSTTAGSAQWQGKCVLSSRDYLTPIVDFEIEAKAETS